MKHASDLVSTIAGVFFPSDDDEDDGEKDGKAGMNADIEGEVKREMEASNAVIQSIIKQRSLKGEIRNAGLLRHLGEVRTAVYHLRMLKETLDAYEGHKEKSKKPWGQEVDGGKEIENVEKVKLGLALHEQLIVVSSDRRVLEVVLDVLAAEP